MIWSEYIYIKGSLYNDYIWTIFSIDVQFTSFVLYEPWVMVSAPVHEINPLPTAQITSSGQDFWTTGKPYVFMIDVNTIHLGIFSSSPSVPLTVYSTGEYLLSSWWLNWESSWGGGGGGGAHKYENESEWDGLSFSSDDILEFYDTYIVWISITKSISIKNRACFYWPK